MPRRLSSLAAALVVGLVAAAVVANADPAAAAAPRPYAVQGDCAGRPATAVGMAAGYCMGLVWQGDGTDGPRTPRGLSPLANGDWLVTDLGAWTAGQGAVWRLSFDAEGAPRLRRLVQGLSLPHTVARGPDGRIYVSEMNRILTLDPDAADPQASVRTVIGGLPDNRLHDNRHPLSSFIFDGDGALLVNVGAPSDRCVDAQGRPHTTASGACIDSAETAQVRRHAYLGNGRWAEDSTVFASGLRNSIALVRHPSGTILQGENSVDLTTPDHPYDEINVLRRGGDYGWPYCVDLGTPLPGWSAAQARCGQRQRPVALLPPHAAPLDLLYYDGAMFPELRGRLLMTWHGFRRTGGRIVAVETDGQGRPLTDIGGRYALYPRGSAPYPTGAPSVRGKVLTPGWDLVAGRQPRGSPVVMAVAADGAIWVTDDRSRAILRIARK
ncbi:sorbosone dehydrogenase family protein [Brevundimonas sp. SORGH_AS_0993]|uniref:PQQ-dependent sugar dehydrogenase n=1 Tax=Brevundimonas sp. SORGH_AS_0993 TaxID=3041794 RepID=UPI00278B80EC|nr:PQQ-dependent sugar dehydrogenase [Brevundimonas sp. SORGH_AS_0993]MDQ1154611.1 glucose/arabinose dehydrogenase [Brevundimonas sp. SORGH_AS_0993]